MMDTEDSQSVRLSSESVGTESPPSKIPRLGIVSAVLDYASSSFSFLDDPYPNSNLETALNKSTVPMVTFVSVQAKPEISEVKPKDSPVQLDKDVTRDQSSDTLPEQEISLPDLYQSVNQGQAQNKDDVESEPETLNDVDLEKRNDEAGNTIDKDGHVSPCPTINVCVLNEILDVLDKNQTKTSEMIVQEYVSCPKRCLKVKEFLRQDIDDFLKSSGENNINIVGTAHLKCTMEKAECSTIIKLLSDAFKRNESKLASKNGSNNSCGPAQISAASENVQKPDNVDEVRMEEDPDADEIIDIPTENMPGSSSSTESPNVVNVENATAWQEKITDMLFRTLHAESRLLRRKEQKIAKMGKRLFSTLFSEEEIRGGFARAKKTTPAYDETRVFEISRIINFMLHQTNGHSLENFRSSQQENEGLDGEDQETFWQTVMIKFASDERRRLKGEQT